MPQDSILTLNTARQCLSNSNTQGFFLLLTQQLPRDVLAGAGFLRHTAAVFRDMIKDTHCSTRIKGNTIIVRILLSSVFPVASCLVTTVQDQTSYFDPYMPTKTT